MFSVTEKDWIEQGVASKLMRLGVSILIGENQWIFTRWY